MICCPKCPPDLELKWTGTQWECQRCDYVIKSSVETTAIVQGHPYDEAKWLEVAEQMHFLGNKVNERFEGVSGHLFWETASSIRRLMDQVAYVNRTQKFSLFPDEEKD